MNSDGHDFDENEEEIVEEPGEDIELSQLDLSGVNLIEDLHEDKCVEDNCEMHSILLVPSFLRYFL